MDACDGPDCRETIKELDLFLDDELSDAARSAIRHHLDGCIDCLQAFDFHAELKLIIARKCQADPLPAGLMARIEECFQTDLDGDGRIG